MRKLSTIVVAGPRAPEPVPPEPSAPMYHGYRVSPEFAVIPVIDVVPRDAPFRKYCTEHAVVLDHVKDMM